MYSPGLNDLDAVLAVARRNSFRGAALDLGMSTTALSSAVAKLEAHLGVRLFNRTTRSVSMSDAGRAFVEKVAAGLADIRGAMDAARSQQAKPSGMLRINTFAMAAREILAPLVLEYLRRYPDVTSKRDASSACSRTGLLSSLGSASTTPAGATPRPPTRRSSH